MAEKLKKKKTFKSDTEANVKAAKKKPNAEVKQIGSSENLTTTYRPKTLQEVFGQKQAVATLLGTFKRGKIPSTMLFSGHYGCGKTSLAMIYARMANCATYNLCGKCFSCKFGSRHPDIVYHDCGKEGKIDDIRGLISKSRASPATQKRFIIVDEVHLLRDQSEKTLLVESENPAPNTVWVFCTTNPEKLAKTLVSRCLHLYIRAIEPEVLVERMIEVAELEGVKVKKTAKKAFLTIAQSSNGSMRESLAKLEGFLNVLASGEEYDPEVLSSFVSDEDSAVDAVAAHVVAGILDLNIKYTITAIRKSGGNPRAIMSKARWLLDFLIGKETGTAKWGGEAYKVFEGIGVKKINFTLLVLTQHMLAELEIKLNSVSLDEAVVFYSSIGSFIAEHK
jgi:DNA polymerase-3 subunit gamma/tau